MTEEERKTTTYEKTVNPSEYKSEIGDRLSKNEN
jgi:hypothetical protein